MNSKIKERQILQKTWTNQMRQCHTHSQTRHSVHKSRIRGVLKKWESKLMLGQYIRSVNKQLVSKTTRCYPCRGEIWKQKLKVK